MKCPLTAVVICNGEGCIWRERGSTGAADVQAPDFWAKPLIENNNSFLHRTVKFLESNCKYMWDGRGANRAKRSTVREKRKAY